MTSVSRRFDQTSDRPYPSLYKAGFVSAADYLCELVFKNRELIFKQKFPESFWNSEKYKGLYVGQKINAGRLLKKYKEIAIIKAVKQTKCISLTDKKLPKVIKEAELEIVEKTIEEIKPLKPAKPFKKQNKLEGL